MHRVALAVLIMTASFGPVMVIGVGCRAALAAVGRNPMAASRVMGALVALCLMAECVGAVALYLTLVLFGGMPG